jgi:hypothetical protein
LETAKFVATAIDYPAVLSADIAQTVALETAGIEQDRPERPSGLPVLFAGTQYFPKIFQSKEKRKSGS